MEDGQMGNELHLHESKIHSGGAKTNQWQATNGVFGTSSFLDSSLLPAQPFGTWPPISMLVLV
jgi:hypothetical protein